MIEEAAIALMTVYVAGMLGWIARSLRARQAKGAYNAIANEWTEKEPETLRKAAEAHNAIMRQNA